MNPSLSTAAASGTVSLAFVVFVQWMLALRGISMPADVASALSTLLAAGVHLIVVRQPSLSKPLSNSNSKGS